MDTNDEEKKGSVDTNSSLQSGEKRKFKKVQMNFKKKSCKLCSKDGFKVSYKNPEGLKKFTTDRGRILPGRVTGLCAKHQRAVVREIERARALAYLPYEKKF